MLVYFYLAALIFGGVLLGSSILLGGHDDADLDLDGDVDIDADVDVDADVDAEIDKDLPLGGDSFLWWLRSMRFWTFFLSAFGLTGMLLKGLGLAGEIPTLVSALAMGGVSGFTAAWVIKKLSSDDAGRAAGSRDYIGKSAKVLVPVRSEGVGKIRVRVRGQTVDLLATTDEAELGSDDEVIVIEMDGTRARVARLDSERETN
jgi:membrane protein implicated in regulation of membrane protease activity